jgi:hypothetical protein
MENKFTGICILISAIILAAAIFWHARVGRYQPAGERMKIDTVTGSVFT